MISAAGTSSIRKSGCDGGRAQEATEDGAKELLALVDAEQFNGWQQLHDSYVNGYPDRHSIGFTLRASFLSRGVRS